jgi:hypothetical protein
MYMDVESVGSGILHSEHVSSLQFIGEYADWSLHTE